LYLGDAELRSERAPERLCGRISDRRGRDLHHAHGRRAGRDVPLRILGSARRRRLSAPGVRSVIANGYPPRVFWIIVILILFALGAMGFKGALTITRALT